MFFRQKMKGEGINITLRDNPGHVLAPDNESILIDFRFSKITPEKFKAYYMDLLKGRWETRRKEFLSLIVQGKEKNIGLRCTCKLSEENCHAHLAAKFMNRLISAL